jgi:hypothetical protein
MIFPHRVTPIFAVVVGCLIPMPGTAATFVLCRMCCSFFSGHDEKFFKKKFLNKF